KAIRIWYRVADLDAARAFYKDVLGFTETFVDEQERWASLDRGTTEIALGEGAREPGEAGPGAHAGGDDVKAERASLAEAGVEVGTVLELHGAMRLGGVYDPRGHTRPTGQELHTA